MGRLLHTLSLCAVIGAVCVPGAAAQDTPEPRSTSSAGEYVFSSPAGILFFHVRPDRTEDFEAVIDRLGEVLDRSTDPVRRQQAASWKIYRSTETARDAVIYLFVFDPAVFGADYDPIKVLGDAVPAEVGALYERLRADVLRVERMGLQKLR